MSSLYARASILVICVRLTNCAKDDVRTQEAEGNVLQANTKASPPTQTVFERDSAAAFPTANKPLQSNTLKAGQPYFEGKPVTASDAENTCETDLSNAGLPAMPHFDSFTLEDAEVFSDSTQPGATDSVPAIHRLGLMNSNRDNSIQYDSFLHSNFDSNYTADPETDLVGQFGNPAPDPKTSTALASSYRKQSDQTITTLPGVWSYSYQMGSAAYSSALESRGLAPRKLTPSNSYFSDHIAGVRSCLHGKWHGIDSLQPSLAIL